MIVNVKVRVDVNEALEGLREMIGDELGLDEPRVLSYNEIIKAAGGKKKLVADLLEDFSESSALEEVVYEQARDVCCEIAEDLAAKLAKLDVVKKELAKQDAEQVDEVEDISALARRHGYRLVPIKKKATS